MQEMVIYGVSFDMVGKQPIVLLKTVDSNKFLPIWIGHPEAAAILMKLGPRSFYPPPKVDSAVVVLDPRPPQYRSDRDTLLDLISVSFRMRRKKLVNNLIGWRELERDDVLAAMERVRQRSGFALYALMVTDIMAKDTDLYVSGDPGPLENAFGTEAIDSVIPLPGVMSRKKQVAPKVLAAL